MMNKMIGRIMMQVHYLISISLIVVIVHRWQRVVLAAKVDVNSPVETVLIDGLASLPNHFNPQELPPNIQVAPKKTASVEFDFLGVIGKLLDREPDDPFSIDTKFHLFNGGQRRTVPFKRFKNCIATVGSEDSSTEKCAIYPVNLNDMLKIFDMNKRTLIIIGGFLMIGPSDWQLKIAHKWLQLEDLNVVIVSWNKGNRLLYKRAVSNTKIVARQVVVFLYYLAKLHNINPRDRKFTDSIVIVGHSLGAHIAGFIGQDFGGKIGRITGLDPAGPAFSMNDQAHRLDRNDAVLVDIFHTNADFGLSFFLGIYKPIGHVDYYANDGKWQPNCSWHNFFECNHGAVINYYISILNHELTIRSHFAKNLREKYRIIAYKAKSYNQFRNGRNMQTNCPYMWADTNDTIYQGGYLDFDRCVVPIDVIKEPRLFRQELNQKYKINFDADHVPDDKFWFFTSAESPYVVDHNLLKVHYHIPKGTDKEAKCSMKMTYTMKDGREERGSLPQFKPTADASNHEKNHMQTTTPFVVSNDHGRYHLIGIETDNFDIADEDQIDYRQISEAILESVYKIFPQKIRFSSKKAIYTGKHPILYKAAAGILSLLSPSAPAMSSYDDGKCPFKFKTIRVQPLRLTNRILMAIYRTPNETNQSHEPNIIVLKKNDSIPKLSAQEDGKSVQDPTVYLDTLIIGPNFFGSPKRESPDGTTTPYARYLDDENNIALDNLDIEAEFMSQYDQIDSLENGSKELIDAEMKRAVASYQNYRLAQDLADEVY